MMRLALTCLAGAALTTLAAVSAQAQPMDETEMMRFLVQAQCADASGVPIGASPIDAACINRSALTPSSPAGYRKLDWAAQQITDAVLTVPPRRAGDPVVVAHTFDFGSGGSGFGQFQAEAGDGGHVIAIQGGRASIFMTQDGGGGLQWVVGDGCRTGAAPSEDAWLLFGDDASRSGWRSTVAQLMITRTRGECPSAFSSSFTRYVRTNLALPFLQSGQPAGTRTLDVIVSEHYDQPSVAQSGHLERFFLAKDLGLVRWERWEAAPTPAAYQQAQQQQAAGICPAVALSNAPQPGWVMADCRTWTNIVPAGEPFSVRAFNWPGLTLQASPARAWGQWASR